MVNYSFIIPHHNSPGLLNRCISSIPTREDIEIIVVDDNSIQELRPQISRRGVKTVYITSFDSKGAGKARNEGIKISTGKWLLFADCDDYYDDGFITDLDAYLNEDIDILFFDAFDRYVVQDKVYDQKNKRQYVIKRFLENKSNTYWTKRLKYFQNDCWAMMIKSEFVKSHNLRFEEVRKGNDAFFHLTAVKAAQKIDAINKKIYYWTWNPESLSHRKWDKEALINQLKQMSRYNKMRVEARAWDTIPPFRRGIKNALVSYGPLFFVKYVFTKFKLTPWLRIWCHQIINTNK